MTVDRVDASSMSFVERRRVLARLRREVHRIGQRDYFATPDREAARRALRAFARLVGAPS